MGHSEFIQTISIASIIILPVMILLLFLAVRFKKKTGFLNIHVKPKAEADNQKDDVEQLQKYARRVEEYLHTSEAYVNPNLSLKEVANATGISTNNLSKSINATLGKNFFDLVNGYRVEKSKALLLAKKEKGLTIETIAEQCGFNSRVTFNNAFKKIIGMTTTNWVKLNQSDPKQSK